jgi:hypothetical protein
MAQNKLRSVAEQHRSRAILPPKFLAAESARRQQRHEEGREAWEKLMEKEDRKTRALSRFVGYLMAGTGVGMIAGGLCAALGVEQWAAFALPAVVVVLVVGGVKMVVDNGDETW